MHWAHPAMKLSASFFLLLALVAWFTGCNSGGGRGGVTVTLVDFKPAGTALPETRAVITLRVTNENLNPLGFSGSTHKLYLNGSYVGKATSSVPLGLPPVSSATQDVPILLEKPEFVKQAMRDQPVSSYRMESALFIMDGEERIQLKVRSEGSVDLRGLRAAAR